MRKIYLFQVCLLATAALMFCSFTPKAKHAKKAPVKKETTGDGMEDDAEARYQYELMMLRDPATGKIPNNIRAKELAFAKTLPRQEGSSFFFDGGKSAAERTTSSVVWQPRGPWNVGGRTRAMGVDVTNESAIVTGTCSGGMWRSTNGGASWTTTTPTNQYQSVSCLTQDTRAGHQNVWYYGTGEAYGASASATGAYYLGDGIFKSTDSGKTWAVLPSTSAGVVSFTNWSQVSWNIVTNPADTIHDVVYCAAYGGIYKSLTGGSSWSLVAGSFVGGDSYFTDVAVSKTGIVYISLSSDGPHKGIYRSPDGVTFTNITPVGFADSFNRIKIGISPMDENQVYFLCNTPSSGTPDTNFLGQVEWNSLWKYNYISGTGIDTGGLWRNLSANLPSGGGIFDKYTCQGSYDIVVKPKPNDTNIVFIGGTNLYRSNSGFADNTHTAFIGGYVPGASLPVVRSYPSHHPDQHELVFLPSNPDKMISSNDGGVFRTDNNMLDTVVWHSLDNGYTTSMFYTCAIDHAQTNDILIGGAQDNGSWFTNTTTYTTPWLYSNGGDGSWCAIADSGKAYYMSIQSGNTRKLRINPAGIMDSFARIDPIGGAGYLFVNPFTLDPNNNNLMYMAGGKYLWRNDNLSGIPYADNWDSIATNWTQFPDSMPVGNALVTAIGVSKNPANRIYVGTSLQKIYRIDNANIGTPTPLDITLATFPPSSNVSCIAVDPNNADSIIVAFSNYGVYSLFFSTNGGSTWTKIAGNLETSPSGAGNGPSLRWVTIAHTPDGIVYLVGTSVGLYATAALNGISTVWTQMGTSTIGESVVNMMDYRETDGLLVVATHSHGMFSTNLTSVSNVTGVSNQITMQSKQLDLKCFPNPFTANTTIGFTLDKDDQVNLTLSDEMGRVVKTIADQAMSAGEHRILLDASGFASGIYYCTVKTNKYSETCKVILTK